MIPFQADIPIHMLYYADCHITGIYVRIFPIFASKRFFVSYEVPGIGMPLGDLMFTNFKNLGRGLAIALLVLGSLSAVVYHDDVFAGKGNGGGGGGGNGGGHGGGHGGDRGGDRGSKGGTSDSAKKGSGSNTNPDPGSSPKSYQDWLSDLLEE